MMINKIKEFFKKPLELTKTHDFSVDKKPKLTVVFIHGIASDSSTFDATLEYLEGAESMKEVRFITFDLLGSGKSYTSDELNYDFKEQLTALENSLTEQKISTPLILVGHSMGCLIATRYAAAHKKQVQKMILVSPPMYREEDIKNPMFGTAMEAFREAVAQKKRKVLKEKAFNNSIDLIISDPENYRILTEITTPTTIIYGELDQIIAHFNLPRILKANPKYISAIQTTGRHGVSKDKYTKILEILEEDLDDKTL